MEEIGPGSSGIAASSDTRQPAGSSAARNLMDSSRLEAFSDGVFAVAITLLALNLVVPGPHKGGPALSDLLGKAWPSFAGYVISFLTIGIIWVNHHTLFKNFVGVDRPALFINLLLLFFVVAIPFATKTVADYLGPGGQNASVAVALFEGVFEGMSLAFGVMLWWCIKHEHLRIRLTPAAARRATIRFGIGNVAYIAAIGIAFVSPLTAFLISLLVAVYYVFEQTPTRAPAPGTGAGGDPGGG
jgi:TMEM175 potassium channel family protein